MTYVLTCPDGCRIAALGLMQEAIELRQQLDRLLGRDYPDHRRIRALHGQLEEVQATHVEAVTRLYRAAAGQSIEAPYVPVANAVHEVLGEQVGRHGSCTGGRLVRLVRERVPAFDGTDHEVYRIANRLGYRCRRQRRNGTRARYWFAPGGGRG